jgi:rSAM/selenodomain-associated transferase 2
MLYYLYNRGVVIDLKVSVIIPILNEIESIGEMMAMLKNIEDIHEIIFADGGSIDGTLDLITSEFKLVRSERGRGIQLNKGAEAASGDVLLFLHCDSVLSKDAIRYIDESLQQGYVGGCFSLAFNKKGFLLDLIAYLSNLRVKLLKVMFGDQGIFIKKEVFDQLGGFPEIPIMEDLEFSLKFKKSARIKQVEGKIITSARRFEKNGVLKTIMFMHKMKLLYFLGKRPEELYNLYKNVR